MADEAHHSTEPTPDNPFFRKVGRQYIRLYYFMAEEHLIDLISSDEIKVSVPDNCNDPLEFLSAEKEGKEAHAADCGFISFSAHFGSSLMWSHYANSHKGVCLQFDFPLVQSGHLYVPNEENDNKIHESLNTATPPDVPNTSLFGILDSEDDLNSRQFFSPLPNRYKNGIFCIKVRYNNIRPHKTNDSVLIIRKDKKYDYFSLDPCIYTKSEEWCYEKEWRLLVDLDNAEGFRDGDFFVRGLTRYITCIIIGKKFPIQENLLRHYLNQAAHINPNKFSRTHLRQCPIIRAQYHPEKYSIILNRTACTPPTWRRHISTESSAAPGNYPPKVK